MTSRLRDAFRGALIETYGIEVPELDPEWAEEIALAWVEERLTGAREDTFEALYAAWSLNAAAGRGWDDPAEHGRGMTDAALDVIRRALNPTEGDA